MRRCRSGRTILPGEGRLEVPQGGTQSRLANGGTSRNMGRRFPPCRIDREQDPGPLAPPRLYGFCQALVGEAGLLEYPDGCQIFWVSRCPHRGSFQDGESEVEQEPSGFGRVPSAPTIRAEVPTELPTVNILNPVDSGPTTEPLNVFDNQVVTEPRVEVRLFEQPWQQNRFGRVSIDPELHIREHCFVGFECEKRISVVRDEVPKQDPITLEPQHRTDSRRPWSRVSAGGLRDPRHMGHLHPDPVVRSALARSCKSEPRESRRRCSGPTGGK